MPPDDRACGLDPGAVTTRAASAPVAGGQPVVRAVAAPGMPEFTGRTVAALPDAWWSSGVEGASRRENLRQKLGGSVSFVPRSVAAAAFQPARRVLTCDVGAHGVTVALSEVDGGIVTPLDVETRADGGTTFERATGAELPALRAAVAGQRRRATLVLDRATAHERWRHTPVFHGLTLTAAELLSCFAPVAEAIRSCAGALMSRRGEVSAVYLFGGLATLPAVGTVLAEIVGRPTLLEPAAVALGALRIAQGQLTVAEETVLFPVRRVLDGRLVASMVPMGEEVTVESARSVTVSVGGRQAHVRLPAVPAGRYECGWWPALRTNGVVVLRPVGGGDPVFAPVEEA